MSMMLGNQIYTWSYKHRGGGLLGLAQSLGFHVFSNDTTISHTHLE